MPEPLPALPAQAGIFGRPESRLSPGMRNERIARKSCATFFFTILTLFVSPATAAEHQDCTKATVVLWGDGRHDDTAALNAWLHGENALWGDSGAPVGPTINWHEFRLSSAIYVSGGTGRTIENFRMNWPERGETVTGGAIRAGDNPNVEPVTSGVHIVGGDAGEGKPFDMPNLPPPRPDASVSCGIS